MSDYTEEDNITVSNIDAARRQLNTAIELWFNDGDEVSVHTLAHTSHEIIDGLTKKSRSKDLLYDTLITKDEYRKKFYEKIREPGNFFKHPARDLNPERTVTFNPAMSRVMLLFSIEGLKILGLTLNTVESAFITHFNLTNPQTLTEQERKLFRDTLPVDYFEKIKRLPKNEFLEAFILLRSKP